MATSQKALQRQEAGWVRRFGGIPGWIVLVLFIVIPLAALFVEAGSDNGAALGRLTADPLLLDAFINSMLLAVATGTGSLLVGTFLAISLAKQGAQTRQWMLAILGLPLAFSGIVIAYGFILAFGRAGFVTTLLAEAGADPAVTGGWIYSLWGLAFAYAYYLIPRVALMLYPVFANLDERPYQAAITLGAPPWRAALDVILREVWPSMLSAWSIVSAIALGTYGTAVALAGTQINILPLLIYLKISDGSSDFTEAAALSLMLMALCSAMLAFGEAVNTRYQKVRHHAHNTPKAVA